MDVLHPSGWLHGTMGASFAYCLLAALCCTLPAWGAEVLSEEDAHILRLLAPASRAALPGWMEAHERLAAEVDAAKGGSVRWLSASPDLPP